MSRKETHFFQCEFLETIRGDTAVLLQVQTLSQWRQVRPVE